MKLFPYAHARHAQWRVAADLVLAQLRTQMKSNAYAHAPTLGLLYISDYYAVQAQPILEYLSAALPKVVNWSGSVGLGVAANNVEYFDEPALVVMLCAIPMHQYRVFSGVSPLSTGFPAHTALVHADADTPDLPDLIEEMAARTTSGYLFGGLASSRSEAVQFAVDGHGLPRFSGADGGVLRGGLSGVAFSANVGLVSRVSQGCSPVGLPHRVTGLDHNVITMLDAQPALDVMLRELRVTLDQPQQVLKAVRATLVGLLPEPDVVAHDSALPLLRHADSFGGAVQVRHIVGLDPVHRGIAVSECLQEGMQLAFCQRNVPAAKADLMRICAEIREELEPQEFMLAPVVASQAPPPFPQLGIAGAVYVSCAERGGAHFGGPSAELQILRRGLGDVPLIGFFADGEIARDHLCNYTGVLTVFTST
jgi:small ligand-binding sensory domain FIST